MTSAPLKCTIDDLADPLPNVFTNAKVVGDGVDFATYSKQECPRGQPGYVMSRGELCEFDICPARWRNGYRDEGSSATEWGKLMDCRVLAPTVEFRNRIAVKPETYENADNETKPWNGNSKTCREWIKEQGGRLIVSSKQANESAMATDVLLHDEDVFQMLHTARTEVMVTADYVDTETGITVPMRCLIDIVPKSDCLADFKTASDASDFNWQWEVFKRSYHTQGKLYLDMFNAATGERREEFKHIVQESFKPWQTEKYALTPEFLSLGREKYLKALRCYCECLKTGIWPGYETGRELRIDGWKMVSPNERMVMA